MKIEEIAVGKKYWTVYGSLERCAGKGEDVVILHSHSDSRIGTAYKPESIVCEFTPEPVAYTVEYHYSPRPWWRFGL